MRKQELIMATISVLFGLSVAFASRVIKPRLAVSKSAGQEMLSSISPVGLVNEVVGNRGISLADVTSAQHDLQEVTLTDAEQDILRYPAKTRWEKVFQLLLLTSRHENQVANSGAFRTQVEMEAIKEGQPAFEALSRIIPTLAPREFAKERAYLLGLAVQLPIVSSKTRDLARNEVGAIIVDSTSEAISAVPMGAHRALLALSSDSTEALLETENAFKLQPSPEIRNAMAKQLVARYPLLEAEMLQKLVQLNTKVTFNLTAQADSETVVGGPTVETR
jgi:hypothetical protein